MSSVTPPTSASGMLRCGRRTSSATGPMFIQPWYAHSTPTRAAPKLLT